MQKCTESEINSPEKNEENLKENKHHNKDDIFNFIHTEIAEVLKDKS